jgi:adenylosuccinate synthase
MSTVYTPDGKGKIVETSKDLQTVVVEQQGGSRDGQRKAWSKDELG